MPKTAPKTAPKTQKFIVRIPETFSGYAYYQVEQFRQMKPKNWLKTTAAEICSDLKQNLG